MNWKDIKSKAQVVVHKTFGLPAVHTSTGGLAAPCSVRKHPETKTVGDPEDAGFASRVQHVNMLVFDTTELMPEIHATVVFDDDGSSYEIVHIMEPDGNMLPVEVVPL